MKPEGSTIKANKDVDVDVGGFAKRCNRQLPHTYSVSVCYSECLEPVIQLTVTGSTQWI